MEPITFEYKGLFLMLIPEQSKLVVPINLYTEGERMVEVTKFNTKDIEYHSGHDMLTDLLPNLDYIVNDELLFQIHKLILDDLRHAMSTQEEKIRELGDKYVKKAGLNNLRVSDIIDALPKGDYTFDNKEARDDNLNHKVTLLEPYNIVDEDRAILVIHTDNK